MFVAVEAGEVHGYIIAQPVAPLLVPAAHEIAAIGVIDDFYDADFADVSAVSNGAVERQEPAVRRGKRVCPTRRRQRARRLPGGMVVQGLAAGTQRLSGRQALDAEALTAAIATRKRP